MSISTTKTEDAFKNVLSDRDKKRLEKALATVLISNIENKIAPLVFKDRKTIKNIMSVMRALKSLY
ncbi:MAG: hypothetical protein ABIM30_00660 [candidate division WOR-3 bacterium]